VHPARFARIESDRPSGLDLEMWENTLSLLGEVFRLVCQSTPRPLVWLRECSCVRRGINPPRFFLSAHHAHSLIPPVCGPFSLPNTPRGCFAVGGGENQHDRYLVDPASSICLSQRLSHACLSINILYGETANGSLYQLLFI
jgi:hypothetical protein